MNLCKTLWLMCGIPGSGKSTWIREHEKYFEPSYKVISRDEIRFSMLGENDDYFSKEKEVWDEYVKQAKDSLSKNDDTILDATHLNEASRTKILRALQATLKNIKINAVVINSGLKTALIQNENRTGREFVPISAIRRMDASMTMPSLEEGFDTIYIFHPDRLEIIKNE